MNNDQPLSITETEINAYRAHFSLNSPYAEDQSSPLNTAAPSTDTAEQQERRDWDHIVALVASLQKELPARQFPTGSSFEKYSKHKLATA